MKLTNAVLRISQKINGKNVVQKLPIKSVEHASQIVQELPITEFNTVIIDDTGFVAEVLPNGRIEFFNVKGNEIV